MLCQTNQKLLHDSADVQFTCVYVRGGEGCLQTRRSMLCWRVSIRSKGTHCSGKHSMYDRARSGICTNGHEISIHFPYFELTESYSKALREAFCEEKSKEMERKTRESIDSVHLCGGWAEHLTRQNACTVIHTFQKHLQFTKKCAPTFKPPVDVYKTTVKGMRKMAA